MVMMVEEEKRKVYIDGIKRTIVPCILGITAGALSTFFLEEGWRLLVMILLMMILIQKPIYRQIGIDMKGKDWVYVAFMTFNLWFVTLTLILTS
jgi:hypothetical protein